MDRPLVLRYSKELGLSDLNIVGQDLSWQVRIAGTSPGLPEN
jgi:hypothetical protein